MKPFSPSRKGPTVLAAFVACSMMFAQVLTAQQETKPEIPSSELREAIYLADVANIDEFDAKYDGALRLAKQQLAQREKDLGPDHELVGRSLTVLGLLYTANRDYTNAEKVLKRARSILEKSPGPECLALSYALTASALYEMQRNADDHSEDWLKRSLAIREKVLGPEALEVGNAALALAEYYQTKRNFKLANQLYDRVFALRSKLLPGGDESVLQVLARQACILRKTNKPQEAAELEFRAGVGPPPEYERNGKYKHPESKPLNGKLRRMSVTWLSTMTSGRSTDVVYARIAISSTGKVLYACSNSSAVASLIPFLYERIIYRSVFDPTVKNDAPVLATGFVTLYNKDTSPLMVITPNFPGNTSSP